MTADGALTAAQEGGAVLQTVSRARKSRGLGDLGATVSLPLHSRAVHQENPELSEPQCHLGDGSSHDAAGSYEKGGAVNTGPMAGVSSHPNLSPITFPLDPKPPLLVDQNTKPPLTSAGILR